MILPYNSMAQKATSNHMDWAVAAALPPQPGAAEALGVAGALAGVHNGVLLIGGGANFPDGMPRLGGKKKYHNEVYVFDKSGSGMGFLKTCVLPFPTAYGASTSTPQGVVYAGGENEDGISKKVLLVQWDDAAKNIVVKSLPPLPVAVTNASITSDANTVYIAGGEMKDSVSTQFLSFDLNNRDAGWQQLSPLPKPVSHAVLVMQSNGHLKNMYLIGGRKKNTNGISDLYASVYEFDLKKNRWSEKRSLPYALSAGTGVAAGSNCILLFGGDKGETFHKTETLIAAINEERHEAKKTELNQQKTALQINHPGFSNDVLQYNTTMDEWKVVDTLPFAVPVTTTAVKWNSCVLIPSGEIKAGVRTPQILMGKLKTCR